MQGGIFFSIANYTILSYCIIYVSSYSLRSLKKQMKEKKKYIDSNKHPYLGHGYGLSAIRFLRRVTRRMMLILPGNFSPPLFACAIHVAQSFVFYIVYCRSLFCLYFGLCTVSPSVSFIWLPVWYLQTCFATIFQLYSGREH